MINKVYVPQGLGVLVLCAAAVFTVWPLQQLSQNIGTSINRLERRVAFIDAYRQEQQKSSYERFGASSMDEPQVFLKLQEAAQKAGMHLEHVDGKPVQANRGQEYQVTAFDLIVSGPETGLFELLEGIKHSGFLCRLVSLEVSAEARKQGLIRARMRIEKIDHPRIKAIFQEKKASAGIKRRLFKESAQSAAKNIGTSQKARPDLIKDLSLVGIVDDNGRKAVIEDKKTQKSVFLKEGDCLEGFCVSEIGSGEVSLEHEGVRFDLVL